MLCLAAPGLAAPPSWRVQNLVWHILTPQACQEGLSKQAMPKHWGR